jgi:hypothetical protein
VIVVTKLPTAGKAPPSPDKLATAEGIMRQDNAILKSLATAGDIDAQIEVAYEVMERRKGALRALAKK